MASSAIFENKNALQEDELEAIKAIFFNVKDLRLNDVWKVNRPPEVEIECTPQSSDSIDAASHNYVSVVLVIKLVPAYPDEIPSITLKDAEGLSDKQVYELKTKLKGLCQDLIGQEMMFELVNYTQSYLYANNKPPAKSFYDQMISNNQKQTEEKARKAEEVERLKRIQEDLEIEAELEKQQNEIREENRRRRQARKMSESEERHTGTSPNTRVSTTSPRRRTRTESSTSSERSATRASVQPVKVALKCPANHKLVKELSFSTSKTQYQVLRGHCTYHDPAGCTLFSSFDTNRGVAVSVQQWTLDFTSSKVTKDQNLNKSHKLLNSAEQDLAKLFKVQDENLIHYLSMLITTEGAKIHIMVLSEARLGLPLTKFVHLPSKIDSGTVKWITAQLVQSLVYLHSKQVVHKDLKPAVIYVDSKIVRVADYGLYRRLNEIQQAATSGNLDSLTNTMKRGQKEDVFRLGMTILFIITKDFNEDERMPTVPTDVAKDLKGFFTRCFNADEKTRWSAKQLLDHPYIKGEQLSDDVPDKPPAVNENNKPQYEVDDPHMEAVLLPEGAGTSRLNSEFQILGIIGRGGFGEVLKVRNKLDRCLYAIKRITLNPKSKVFNRRITREVKLLSRLNHENVVRYFNSWIETSEEIAESDSTTDTTTSTSPGVRRKLEEDSCSVERNAPGMVDRSVTWSVASSQHDSDSTSSDDESSSDEADLFGHSFMSRVDSDSDVIFDDGSSAGSTSSHVDESSSSGATKVQKSPPKPAAPLHTQFMYIQMEFCEKNTLRQAIDSGLHENLDRVWRLFREVIEGLVHLHDQGMIHRDLKPVNIFLDLNDHVKIGDFGLATTAMIAKLPEGGMGGMTEQTHSVDAGVSHSMSVGDGRHTGRVGTLLYVSPEIKSSHGKTSYSQKVDIYSLGIIFFEMCYRPLTTLMERDKIIGNLRRPEIILPNDFICEQNSEQTAILKWILDHDADKRPSAAELLQSDYLPQMEEQEVDELFRSTLANPQTKSYKKLISTIFSQPISRKFDFIYDNDAHKGVNLANLINKQIASQRLKNILGAHGAVELDVPLMLPKLSIYESCSQLVTFMDSAGNLVSLPFDLRVPFARFVARNNISNLKRYSISKVFRERKPHGIQPHEYIIAAFDIISSSKDSITPDVEVIFTIQQILDSFPYLQAKSYSIQINHSSLLKGILLFCGLPEDQLPVVYEVLTDSSNNKAGDGGKTSAYTKLLNSSINEKTASQICTFIAMNGSLSSVSGFLRRITKSGQQAASLVKTGLHEIENLIAYSSALGVTLPMVVNLGYVYEIHNCSGILYEIAAETTSTKHKSGLDVIACGYRYDRQVTRFKRITRPDGGVELAAAGMSLVFDKLVNAVAHEKSSQDRSLVQVVLSCTGKPSVMKECLKIANELWSNNIKIELLSDMTLEMDKMVSACRDIGCKYLITLTDYEPGFAKLGVIEKERLTEKKYLLANIVEEVVKKLIPFNSDKNSNRYQQGDYNSIMPSAVSTSDKSDRSSDAVTHAFLTPLPITLINAQDARQTQKVKSKIETTIHNRLASTVLCLLKKSSEAEVVAFDLSLAEIKVIASVYVDSDDEQQFSHNCNITLEKQESARYRKYISKILNRLAQMKFQSTKPSVLILYGIKDDSYRVLVD